MIESIYCQMHTHTHIMKRLLMLILNTAINADSTHKKNVCKTPPSLKHDFAAFQTFFDTPNKLMNDYNGMTYSLPTTCSLDTCLMIDNQPTH